MDLNSEEELEGSFLPAYALARNILYSDYGRKTSKYSKTQISILAVLYWHDEMFMSQIADLIAAPRPQVTRAMIPLADDGLVERFEHSSNRKLVHIRLAETGRQYMKNYLQDHFETLRKNLSDEESTKLILASRTIVEILNKGILNNKERFQSMR